MSNIIPKQIGSVLLKELKERIKDNEKLQDFADIFDDKLLVGFLRGKRNDMEKTMACLEHFVHVRTVKYAVFTQTFLPSTVTMLDKDLFHILRYPDPNGRVVAVVQMCKWDPSIAPIEDAIATGMFVLDEGIRTYFSTGNELVLLFDCNGLTFSHAKTVTPRIAILLVNMFVKAIPSRPKAVHIIHEGFVMHNLYRLFKNLLHKKLRERINMHASDLEKLHNHLPPAILPDFLGGDLTVEEAFDTSLPTSIRRMDGFYENMARKI